MINNITKVSEITVEDIAEYLRLTEYLDITEVPIDPDDPDAGTQKVIQNEELENTLNTLLNVSKAYIMGYTGRTIEDLDKFNDFVIVVLVLIQDMYDNRTFYVDNTNLNNIVTGILSMHSINYL